VKVVDVKRLARAQSCPSVQVVAVGLRDRRLMARPVSDLLSGEKLGDGRSGVTEQQCALMVCSLLCGLNTTSFEDAAGGLSCRRLLASVLQSMGGLGSRE
jgi:hypothetical protein